MKSPCVAAKIPISLGAGPTFIPARPSLAPCSAQISSAPPAGPKLLQRGAADNIHDAWGNWSTWMKMLGVVMLVNNKKWWDLPYLMLVNNAGSG